MTYAEVRKLIADVVRSNGRFELWSAQRALATDRVQRDEALAAWVVVVIDTYLGRTFEVRDYAVFANHFPALPEVGDVGLVAGWLPEPARLDGYLSWGQVRSALHALDRSYPVCALDALERSSQGWACIIACEARIGCNIELGPMCRADVYVPGDDYRFFTALTLQAVEDLLSRHSVAA